MDKKLTDPDFRSEESDVDDFLRDAGNVARDDELLSLIGEGWNLDVPGDAAEQDLVDMFGAWRDEVNAEPARDTAIGQEYPQGGEWPPITTGGTVSVKDEAERLRALAASRDIPIEILNHASTGLDGLMGQVRDILGSVSVHLGPLEALVQEMKSALETAVGAGKQFEVALYAAADAHARG